MNVKSSIGRFGIAALALAAAVTACISDDDSSAGGGADAGGVPPPPTPPSGSDASGGNDTGADSGADAPSDAPSDTTSDGDAAPRACTTGPTDASSRALDVKWQITAPTGTGTPTVVGSIVQTACTISLVTLQTATAPPAYSIYLEKKDTTAGSCTEAKGYRVLFSTFAAPAAFLARSPLDATLFVVAYNHKNTPSGSSPVQLSMEQADWTTGDTVHAAGFAVIGSSQLIPPAGSPTALSTNGCDVTLEGTGTFPGASGTNTGAWTAQYVHFLAPEPQDPSLANTAAYK